jgi:NADPH-dependent curcumin reductase CurA
MSEWVRSGQITIRETIVEGIEEAPKAFMGLFTGENLGKMVVKVEGGD